MIKEGKNEVNNGLVGGALALTVSVFIVKLIGYLYKLPLSHILGDEGMGYFNSAYSVFSFFYMLSLGGVPRAVAVTVADARYRYGMRSARKILKVSLALFLSIGISFAAILMIFSGFFSRVIGNGLAKFSLVCIAPSLSFVSAAGVLRGYLNGIGKLKAVAVAEVLDGTSKFATGLAFALASARKGMSAYMVSAHTILGVSIGAFVGAVFMLVCSKNEKTQEKEEQKRAHEEKTSDLLKNIIRIAAPITLSSAIMGATNIIDLGMIMKRLVSVGFSEVEAVALYGNFTTLVIPLLNLASAFVTPFATASMPYIAKHRALGESDEYYALIGQIIFLTSFFISPIALSYLMFSNEVLSLLFNDASALIAAPLLSAAAVSVLFSAMLIMTNTVLESSGYCRVPLYAMGCGAVVKMIAAYLLIGRLGIYGAPLSTVLCYVTACFISALALKTKIKGRGEGIYAAFIPVVISSLVMLIAKYVYINLCSTLGFEWIFIPYMLFVALIYLAVGWIFMRKRLDFLCKYVKIAKK